MKKDTTKKTNKKEKEVIKVEETVVINPLDAIRAKFAPKAAEVKVAMEAKPMVIHVITNGDTLIVDSVRTDHRYIKTNTYGKPITITAKMFGVVYGMVADKVFVDANDREAAKYFDRNTRIDVVNAMFDNLVDYGLKGYVTDLLHLEFPVKEVAVVEDSNRKEMN